MPSVGFEPATPATKRPQTYTLDRAATEVGIEILVDRIICMWIFQFCYYNKRHHQNHYHGNHVHYHHYKPTFRLISVYSIPRDLISSSDLQECHSSYYRADTRWSDKRFSRCIEQRLISVLPRSRQWSLS
jgi:hypothetical protein